MTQIVVANIIALIASVLMVYSGFLKTKKKILYIQTIQIGLSVISNVILGGITGAIINALGFVRNILCYKNKLNIITKSILIILSVILSLKFNNLGIIGLLPLISIVLYTLFLNIKDVINFKLLIIFTMIMWFIYDLYIKSYASALFDFINIIANIISIIQIKNKNIMYDYNFSAVYDKYGWDYFSNTFSKATFDYFNNKKYTFNTVLDLGCGVGTLCDYFSKEGKKTTGIDISPYMLDIARRKNTDVNFIEGDITNFNLNQKFDLITSSCDVVNHILTIDKIEKFFLNSYNHLNDNGYMIFDIYDEKKLVLNSTIKIIRDDEIFIEFFMTKENKIINTNVKVYKNKILINEKNIKEIIISIEDLIKIIEQTGFKIEKIGTSIINEEQRFKDKLYIIIKKGEKYEWTK